MGRTEFLTSKTIASAPWLDRHCFNYSEMARSSECKPQGARKSAWQLPTLLEKRFFTT
jgi:hypothetical protein